MICRCFAASKEVSPARIPVLRFEENGHRYTWNGESVPSVTQVLHEWREVTVYGKRFFVHTINGTVIEGEVMDVAAAFGTAIHHGAKLVLMDDLDWDSLDPVLVGPLREFEKWMDDYKVKPLHIEEPMYSEKHGVAGTPDIIGMVNGFRHLDITDIKTGLVSEMVGPQVAGYELIFRERERYRKPIVRHELILPRDGSPYRFNELTNSQDGAFFMSRLFQWQYLNAK